MADVITITEEDIAKVTTYVPLETKISIANIIAAFCVEKADNSENSDGLYRENRKLRQMFLMGILAEMYLHKDYKLQTVKLSEDGEAQEVRLLMDLDEYDRWASSHVMNQLERLKKDKTKKASNLMYDLLFDYKAFEGIVFGAIRDTLEAKNDILRRATAALSEAWTPETAKTAARAIKEIGSEIAEIGVKRNENG
jgi:hypothetical protein